MSNVGTALRPRLAFLHSTIRTSAYWQDRQVRQRLGIALLLGLVLRLVLMPISAHNDYLDSHWRSEQMVERKVPYPSRSQFLSHAVDAAWLLVLTPLLPDRAALFAAAPSQNGRLDAQPSDYQRFVDMPRAQWALFLTKLVYLFVDVATGFALLCLFSEVQQGLLAFALWMANPATLFAEFIYGRYEAYAIAAVVLSLVAMRWRRPFVAALLLGCAIAFRATPILLLPVYALGLSKSRWQQLAIVALALLPQVAQVLLMERVLGYVPAYNIDHPTGPLSGLNNTLFAPFPVFPLLVSYVLLLLWLDQQSASWWNVARGSLAVYLFMYIFGWHSAHYISWLAPFIVPLIAWGSISLRNYVLFIAAWALFWVTASDGGVFTTYLFAPLTHSATPTTPPRNFIMLWAMPIEVNSDQLTTASRSVLCAVAAWIVFHIYASQRKNPPINQVESDI